MLSNNAIIAALLIVLTPCVVLGQGSPPAKDWTGNFGADVALTDGNTDTQNFNLSFGIVHDPKTKNVFLESL